MAVQFLPYCTALAAVVTVNLSELLVITDRAAAAAGRYSLFYHCQLLSTQTVWSAKPKYSNHMKLQKRFMVQLLPTGSLTPRLPFPCHSAHCFMWEFTRMEVEFRLPPPAQPKKKKFMNLPFKDP